MAGASEQGLSDRRVPTPPSADPEVDGPSTGPARRAKWPWWLAIAALAGGGWFWFGRGGAEAGAGSGAGGAAKAGAARAVPVVAATARKGDLALHLTGLGSVAPFHTVVVRSRVDGVLDTVCFIEGSLVKVGDPLAQIDPRQFAAQLAQAEGQRARDQALLDKAMSDLERAVASEKALPAQGVVTAEALVRQYEGSVKSGTGQLEKDQALLRSAQSDLDRYRGAGSAVSDQQIATTEAVVRQYEGAVKSDQGQVERDQALRDNAKADLVRLRAGEGAVPAQEVVAAKATVAQYEGIVKADQAAVDQAELLVSYARITAPLAGRIGFRRVDPGNMVRATDAEGLAVITELAPISVVFSLPQDDLVRVTRRLAAEKTPAVEAFDRDLRKKLATGTLVTLDNQIDASTGTFRLKAMFSNEDGALFPNQFVNARLTVEVLAGAVVVPVAAVQRGPKGAYVFIVLADQTVELRPVEVGPGEGDEIAITSGLVGGEVVVTDGVDKIADKTKVSVRTAGAAPAPAAPPKAKPGP